MVSGKSSKMENANFESQYRPDHPAFSVENSEAKIVQ
jgi:hypothetical protein